MTSKALFTALLALALAGCGGASQPAPSPASSPAAAAKPPASAAVSAKPASGDAGTAKAALDEVYQKAKAEGQVNWYSSSADSIAAPLVEAFQKTYPGVKIERTVKPAPQVMTDVQVQQAAKKVTIDVAQSADLNIIDTLSGKLPMPVDWAKIGVAPDRIFEGQLVNYLDSPFLWIYNKEKVPADQVPKTWDDYVNPRWQGKLALDGRGTFLATFIAAPEIGGADKGLDLAKKLADLKPIYQASFTAIEPIVISGEAVIGNDALSNVLAAQKKGAPIDIVPVSPVYTQRSPAYVPAGAPHPAAAQLLIAWLASPEGQQVVASTGYGAALSCTGPDQQGPAAQAMCTRGMKSAMFTQMSHFQQLADYLTQVQKNLGTYTGK